MQLLNASPLLTCTLCSHVSTPGDEVEPGKSSAIGWLAPACYDPERCRRTRLGLPRTEPVVIRVAVPQVTCGCCGARLSGKQHVNIQGGQVFHWSHILCNEGCRERRAEAVAV